MPVKLSICIPTFNRATQLDRLLGFICPAISSRSDFSSIELCVSDNASTDSTPSVLKKYCSDAPFLSARRNNENIGFGRNLWATVEMAQGEYVYFTGDDDEFCPNGLDSLLANVEKMDANLLLFNSHQADGTIEHATEPGGCLKIGSQEEYLKKMGIFHASFIGNLCFKKSAFLDNSIIGDAIHLSAYPHMFPVLRILSSGACVFVNSPITKPDDSFRVWHKMQPIYTSIDMARIMREEVLPFIDSRLGRAVKKKLARSLPRVLLSLLGKKIMIDPNNPFQSVCLSNLYSIYIR